MLSYIVNRSDHRLLIQRHAPWNLERISNLDHGHRFYLYDERAGDGIAIYVLDSGIQVDHDEFQLNRASVGRNFVLREAKGDLNGHGTAVSSVMAGLRYGVAKKARLISMKVVNKNGRPLVGDVISAIEHVMEEVDSYDHKAVIYIGFTRLDAHELRSAVDKAVALGVPVIVPSGDANEDACLYSPSSSRSAIVVGATDRNNKVIGSNFGPCVDLFAPGAEIRAAYIGNELHNRTYNGYGSSFAAAHVTGVAALLLSVDPSLTPQQLKSLLLNITQEGLVKGVDRDTPNRFLFNRYEVDSRLPSRGRHR
ncbi:Subtilase-type proteinase psp3 [Halotydeus destructor]|nr:Subtilase-type proteinase psp3 [Halotydeus destructor]